jgi:hypothetical protein
VKFQIFARTINAAQHHMARLWLALSIHRGQGHQPKGRLPIRLTFL